MALAETYADNVRPILDAIDDLRSVGITRDGIDLPTIVVVGDQSSGKSSVLESLSGVTLPKGDGIVTRVPLVLRMQSAQTDEEEKFTLSYDLPTGHVSLDIPKSDIDTWILQATAALAGESKGIENKPLTLNVVGKDLPDLTLVDLPGITRKPVGSQPRNIYELIEAMIKEYISPSATVILNVLPADTDFSLSQSLVLSEEVDPTGERTLAVVTKVDRKPDGLKDKVEKNEVNIGLGYVLVRNKTHNEESHAAARAAEEEFFSTHPELRTMDESNLGVPALARMLSQIQATRLLKCLPGIRAKVSVLLKEKKDELSSIPRVIDDPVEAVQVVNKVLRTRSSSMAELMQGCYGTLDDESMHYATKVQEYVDAFAGELTKSSRRILTRDAYATCRTVLRQASGVSLPNILGHDAVKRLVHKKIKDISPLCFKLVDDVFLYAADVMSTVSTSACVDYPDLEACLASVGFNALAHAKDAAIRDVQRCMERERSANFTASPNYMKTIGAVRAALDAAPGPPSAPAKQELGGLPDVDISPLVGYKDEPAVELQVILFSYWQVVVSRLIDHITMEVRLLLKEALIDKVDDAALAVVHSQGALALLSMPPAKLQRRKALEQSISRLERSQEILFRLGAGTSMRASADV